jgi:hypothetical protein
MKAKRLTLESFKSLVKKIIKEEMESQMPISRMIYLHNQAIQDYDYGNTDTFTREENRQKVRKLFDAIKNFLNEKANQTAKQINKIYQAVVEVKDLSEDNIFLRFYFGKPYQVRTAFSPGYRSFILDLKLVNGKREINFEREQSLFNPQEMAENYMQILKDFASDIFDNVSPSYSGTQLEESKKEDKPTYSKNELAAYIIELNNEIKAYKSRGEDKKVKLLMKDLEEAKAKLAKLKK